MTTVTKDVTFDAAHLLTGHEGLCRNLHGHTYHLYVSASGSPDASGMIVDFKRLKKVIEDVVTSRFDHAFLYDDTAVTECELGAFLEARGLRTVRLGFRTTAENLAKYFFEQLAPHIPVSSVKLYETPHSCAEYARSEPHPSQG